jgi:hypothetical protein
MLISKILISSVTKCSFKKLYIYKHFLRSKFFRFFILTFFGSALSQQTGFSHVRSSHFPGWSWTVTKVYVFIFLKSAEHS